MNAAENLSAGESCIRDTDMASRLIDDSPIKATVTRDYLTSKLKFKKDKRIFINY